MAKPKKKKAAGTKKAAKKAAAKPKKAAAPKKPAKPVKPAKSKAKKAPPKKAAAKIKKVAKKAKKVAKAAKKTVAKVAKAAAKPIKAAAKPIKAAAKPIKAAVKPVKAAAKPVKAAVKAAKPAPLPAKAAKPAAPKAILPPPPAARPATPEPEKKRGRRARPRVHSNGAPAAAWLSTEKPRPASFIPAPPRAEAPSAIAAPPASSDRLIRPEDVAHPQVRTVPVRIDVEQGAGRFYIIANPNEVSLKMGEGIEWDFRYVGGADVAVDEIIVEFERPSPFSHTTFRTRKPGGARPHRQLSGGALPSSIGKRIEYTVRAMNTFKTEIAQTKLWMNVTA